ncbi:3-deoxy-7-phosphoheptulonate synthase [Streptomyces sp. H51]|uniref:3-deoxy-7-phosphoheptulonate synthase n=1 Tax=Streptomyces sp. H51 TaxID=3111770 RepID=UPI002D7841A7|nr:3-deoxy-7-phosphoheptulonate synthase [Streptomyces sp. H51]
MTVTTGDGTLLDPRAHPPLQQPDWGADPRLPAVREELVLSDPLVASSDVRRLRALLAEVATGRALVVQAGDCAEDFAECTRDHVARKAGLLEALAGVLTARTRLPVVRVGRMAGQFAKPRSQPTERVEGVELPVYRGHMVNSPVPERAARRPDPLRLLHGYTAARQAMGHLGWLGERSGPGGGRPSVWTSHEALLLDYEMPLIRCDEHGRPLLTSTHWPWIGERTRQPDGPHVALLSDVVNPVACKVGPDTSVGDVLRLCARLDPHREPGRLTLVARMGADLVGERLPALVWAVRAARHPVVWLTDPMHGNTVSTEYGLKTRRVESVIAEVEAFQRAVRSSGGVAGGLHLETTPHDVVECDLGLAGDRGRLSYTTLCDPRLNLGQAVTVVSAWRS